MSYNSGKTAAPMPDATTPLSPQNQPHAQPQQYQSHQEQPSPAYQQQQASPVYQQPGQQYGQPQQQQENPYQQGGPYQQPMGQPIAMAQPVAMVPGSATAVMFIQPGVTQFPNFPVRMRCPCCNADIQTRIVKEPGALAWLSCGGLAIIGCIFGCCLIPFCVDSFKDTEHWCPSCNQLIGKRTGL